MEKQILGYYSHNVKIHKTEREKREIRFIGQRFKGFVVNPYSDLKGKNPYEMNVNFRAIERMNFLIVSALNGTISRSSYYEVKQALEMRIPVFEIQAVANTFKIKRVVKLVTVSERNLSAFGKLVSMPSTNIELKNNKYLK
jgi:hypothetical protein